MENSAANSGSSSATSPEVFALTDEQIVGLGPAESSAAQEGTPQSAAASSASETLSAAPAWLAERMRDPWHGDEATELWEGKQRAEKEIGAYREAFATAEDARSIKALYPGGLTEAKAAAERARELDAIDASFFRGDSSARAQLAERMMQQDPGAFREMVEAGLKLLNGVGSPGTASVSASNDRSGPTALGQPQPPSHQATAAQSDPSPETLRAYTEFEKAANAELEQTVGASITRVLEDALPNLRLSGAVRGREGEPGAAPLRGRLTSAVREEVEAALKSDQQLGEQVARVLSGRRFDPSSRAQVVRLIDARAQELVPGAVRRVVSSWTQTTLATKSATTSTARPPSSASENTHTTENPAHHRNRRVDYGRLTDEQILSL
jgi:hypothetical protein